MQQPSTELATMKPVRLTIEDTLGAFCDALRREEDRRHGQRPIPGFIHPVGFNPPVLIDGRYYLLRNVATFEKTPHHGMTVEYPGQSWTAEDPDNDPLGPGVVFDVQPVGSRLDVVALCQHDAYLPAFARLLDTIQQLYPDAKKTAAPADHDGPPNAPEPETDQEPEADPAPPPAAPEAAAPEPDQEPEADTTPQKPAAYRPLDLTPMEERIADLYADGKTPAQIAELLEGKQSAATIEVHQRNIRRKLKIYLHKTVTTIQRGKTPGLLATLHYGTPK